MHVINMIRFANKRPGHAWLPPAEILHELLISVVLFHVTYHRMGSMLLLALQLKSLVP